MARRSTRRSVSPPSDGRRSQRPLALWSAVAVGVGGLCVVCMVLTLLAGLFRSPTALLPPMQSGPFQATPTVTPAATATTTPVVVGGLRVSAAAWEQQHGAPDPRRRLPDHDSVPVTITVRSPLTGALVTHQRMVSRHERGGLPARGQPIAIRFHTARGARSVSGRPSFCAGRRIRSRPPAGSTGGFRREAPAYAQPDGAGTRPAAANWRTSAAASASRPAGTGTTMVRCRSACVTGVNNVSYRP